MHVLGSDYQMGRERMLFLANSFSTTSNTGQGRCSERRRWRAHSALSDSAQHAQQTAVHCRCPMLPLGPSGVPAAAHIPHSGPVLDSC